MGFTNVSWGIATTEFVLSSYPAGCITAYDSRHGLPMFVHQQQSLALYCALVSGNETRATRMCANSDCSSCNKLWRQVGNAHMHKDNIFIIDVTNGCQKVIYPAYFVQVPLFLFLWRSVMGFLGVFHFPFVSFSYFFILLIIFSVHFP